MSIFTNDHRRHPIGSRSVQSSVMVLFGWSIGWGRQDEGELSLLVDAH